MNQALLDRLTGAYERTRPLAVVFWHSMPLWVRWITAVTLLLTSVIILLQVLLGKARLKRIGEYFFNIALSLHHNYGSVIGDCISGISLIGFGLSLAAKIQGHHTVWFWITLSYSIYATINRHVRVTTTSSGFKVFFENRSTAAQALHRHNEKYPPTPKTGFNYRKSQVTADFVEDILENHLDFLHKTLKLGFSLYGKDNYSASLLVYNPKLQEWHKWKTVFERGIAPSKIRRSSTWPMARTDFKLPAEMYSRSRPRLFDVQQIKTDTYEAFLTIPLYFRRGGTGSFGHERKGDLFGALSYTNSNPVTLSNLTAEKFLKYFALEMAVIERIAFRIYRDYNF